MLFYLVVGIILFVYFTHRSKWEAAVLLFTAFIMQQALLGLDDQLLGFIDHRSIASILVFFTAYNKRSITVMPAKDMDKLKRTALFLGIFIIIVLTRYIEIKEGIIRGNLEMSLQLKRILREGIYMAAVYVIIRRMYDEQTLKGLENGLIAGAIIAMVSIIFAPFFIDMGFSLHEGGRDNRLSGFLGLNPNNAAGVVNVLFAFVLAKNEKLNRFSFKHIVFISFLLIGLFLLASRSGFVGFLFLAFVYIIRTAKSTNAILKNVLILSVTFGTFFYFFGDFMAERLRQYYSGENDSFSDRQGYWLLYLTDIAKNPDYLIIGNFEEPTYNRDVHNTYIHYLFFSGIFSLLIALFKFRSILTSAGKYMKWEFAYSPMYATAALMISWLTGAGYMHYWFVLIIAASAGIPAKYLEKQRSNPTPWIKGPAPKVKMQKQLA